MANVELQQVRKSYGTTEIIQGIDLAVHDQELTVFVGPSGCGKSTLLRLIAGLEEITDGVLTIDGQRVNDVPPAKRGLALVFQSYALYPHMTVAENMSFSLKLAGASKAERDTKVLEAAHILNLEALLDRKPKELSGGQRQRVAIGRAIVRQPKVFLFDEPLSNLDAALRVRMRMELVKLHRELHATMIYVTHDQVEAMTMADRIVVMQAGRIEQVGPPMELYRNPKNLFVAGFIGSPKMNFLKAIVKRADESGMSLTIENAGVIDVPRYSPSVTQGAAMTLGVRPEHISLVEAGDISARVQAVEHLGGESYLYAELPSGETLTVRVIGETTAAVGDLVYLTFEAGSIHIFDGEDLTVELDPTAVKGR